MIKIIEGDLFSAPEVDYIVHGCNCFHKMGHGVAKIISDEYPEAEEVDKKKTIYGDRKKLGSYSYWQGKHSRIKDREIRIINGYTQYKWGKNGDISAIDKLFDKLTIDYPDGGGYEGLIIGMPLIGCGIAGLSWTKQVYPILEKYFKDSAVDIHVYILPGMKVN